MKNVIVASAIVAAWVSGASAADLPMRAPPPYLPPPPVFTWTGFYLGVNAGYAFDHESRYTLNNGNISFAGSALPPPLGNGGRPGGATITDDGFTGGGQIGYNYQFGALNAASIVIGIEADAAYTDLDKTVSLFNGATETRFRSQLDYLGTVRGRLGLAFDHVLIYGTGGFAYGQVENQTIFFNANGTTRLAGGQSSTSTGYAVGGGLEYALPTDSFLNFFHSSAVTLKAEYLYYDLGQKNFAINAIPGNGAGAGFFYGSRVETDGNLVRVGLNYKF